MLEAFEFELCNEFASMVERVDFIYFYGNIARERLLVNGIQIIINETKPVIALRCGKKISHFISGI